MYGWNYILITSYRNGNQPDTEQTYTHELPDVTGTVCPMQTV